MHWKLNPNTRVDSKTVSLIFKFGRYQIITIFVFPFKEK